MSHLTLVKNNEKEEMNIFDILTPEQTELVKIWKKSPAEHLEFLQFLKNRTDSNIFNALKKRRERVRSIAYRELMLIRNHKALTEGKERLYNNVSEAFKTFASLEDIIEESAEIQSAAYYILLYFIDKLCCNVSIELDSNNQVIIIGTDESVSNEYLKLLKYLLDIWVRSTQFHYATPYNMISELYLN